MSSINCNNESHDVRKNKATLGKINKTTTHLLYKQNEMKKGVEIEKPYFEFNSKPIDESICKTFAYIISS